MGLRIFVSCLYLCLTSGAWLLATASDEPRRTLEGAAGTRVESICWKPRILMYHNILTDEECQHLIEQGKPHLTGFEAYDFTLHKLVPHKNRTGTGYFLPRGQDGMIRRMERRIADVTFFPEGHIQGMHILKYEPGQVFGPHRDQPIFSSFNMRVATMLIYLTDPPPGGGGETVFPLAEGVSHSNSSCGARGLVVTPKKGSAVMFYGLQPDGTLDQASLHQGCPPIGGDKWAATKIMWQKPFTYELPRPAPSPRHSSPNNAQAHQRRS